MYIICDWFDNIDNIDWHPSQPTIPIQYPKKRISVDTLIQKCYTAWKCIVVFVVHCSILSSECVALSRFGSRLLLLQLWPSGLAHCSRFSWLECRKVQRSRQRGRQPSLGLGICLLLKSNCIGTHTTDVFNRTSFQKRTRTYVWQSLQTQFGNVESVKFAKNQIVNVLIFFIYIYIYIIFIEALHIRKVYTRIGTIVCLTDYVTKSTYEASNQ